MVHETVPESTHEWRDDVDYAGRSTFFLAEQSASGGYGCRLFLVVTCSTEVCSKRTFLLCGLGVIRTWRESTAKQGVWGLSPIDLDPQGFGGEYPCHRPGSFGEEFF